MNKETKFDVGTWLRVPKHKHIFQFISTFTEDETEYIADGYDAIFGQQGWTIDEVEFWQPQPGEWCWFYAHIEGEHLSLGKFLRRKGESYLYYDISLDKEVITFYCEPFIGTLPSIIKD